MSRSKMILKATLEVDLDDLANDQLYAEKPVLIIKDGFVPVRKFALDAIISAYEKAVEDLEHIMTMNSLGNNAYHLSGLHRKHLDEHTYLRRELAGLKHLLNQDDEDEA